MKCTCPECNLTFDTPQTAPATIMCPICDTQFPAPAGPASIQRLPTAVPPIMAPAPAAAPAKVTASRRQLIMGVVMVLGLVYLVVGIALAVHFLTANRKPVTPDSVAKTASPPASPVEPAPTPPTPLTPTAAAAQAGPEESKVKWESKLKALRSNGLDLVIVFDSTGSMDREITQLKTQIKRIGNTLMELVPSARISVCTYRDFGDQYVVKGLPLSNDIQKIERYLQPIRAGGGGDDPEAVQEGLRWAIENNEFRKDAAKVILLFGDARPHLQDQSTCERYAAEFHTKQQGIVSTVTCRKPVKIAEFVKIASAGGGESFLVSEPKLIVEQLVILVFGSEYRDKVLEAFKLLEK